MRQIDEGFTYEFNIIHIVSVIRKIVKMFNKYLLIDVLIKRHCRAGWLSPSELNMHAQWPGSLLRIHPVKVMTLTQVCM